MRARLAAMVLPLLLAAFALVTTAGAALAAPASDPSPAMAGHSVSAAPSASAPDGSGPDGSAADGSAAGGAALDGLADGAAPDPSATSAASATSAGSSQPSASVHGTVVGPVGEEGARGPIEGVKISVTQDGKEIGTAATDKDGKWEIAVPQPGTYQVTLDISTLPKTVQLKNEGGETLPSVRVQSGFPAIAIFPLVKEGEGAGAGGGAGGGGDLAYMLSVAVAGIRFGLIIAMTAVGLSLIFGTTGLINFAHGELVTIGAVMAYIFGTTPFQWPFIAAIVIAIIVVGVLGGLIEYVLWRPLRRRGTGLIQMFIISIGLSLLLRHIVLFFFGGERQQYAQATIQAPIQIGPIGVAPRDLIIIIVSIVVLIGMALMLQRTRMGKAMRALSDNRDLAEASGIDVKRVILQVWILGGGLAALGGVFFGLTTAVYWNMGFYLLLLMFAGVILGGLGSAYGAMLGSIVVGLVAQFSTVWFPADLQNAWALLVLIIVLLVRPQGILGRLQRAG